MPKRRVTTARQAAAAKANLVKARAARRRNRGVVSNPYSTTGRRPQGKRAFIGSQRLAVRRFGTASGMTGTQRDKTIESLKRRKKASGRAVLKRRTGLRGQLRQLRRLSRRLPSRA